MIKPNSMNDSSMRFCKTWKADGMMSHERSIVGDPWEVNLDNLQMDNLPIIKRLTGF